MQNETNQVSKSRKHPIVILAVALLVAVSAGFIVLFISIQNTATADQVPEDDIEAIAAALLANADAERGEALIGQYGCTTCHRSNLVSRIAPAFEEIREQYDHPAMSLSPAAYIYQSIVQPSAYVVEGYNNIMPQDFGQRVSDEDLGHMIAYLLAMNAQ